MFCLQIRTDAQKELEMEEVRREASTQGKLAGHAGLRHEMELLERERDAALAEVATQRMEVKTKTELVREANGKHSEALEITEDFKLRLRQAQARVKELEAGWGEREAASIKATARISADGDAPDVEAVDRSVDRSVDQSPMSPPRSAYKDVQALRETHAWRHEGADPGADLGAEVNIESVEQAAEIIRADRAALRMERSLRAAGEKRLALVEGNAPESAVLAVLKEAQEDKASAEERASKAEYAAAAAAARENEARGRLTKLVDDAYGLTSPEKGEKPNPEESNRTDEDAEPGAENGHKNGHDASPDDADEPFVPAVKPIADTKKMMTRLYHRLEHSGSPTPSEKDELRAESIERKKKLGEWTPADDVDERWRCESEELNKMSADALRRRCVELELTTEEARRMAHDAEMRAELATQRALKAERTAGRHHEEVRSIATRFERGQGGRGCRVSRTTGGAGAHARGVRGRRGVREAGDGADGRFNSYEIPRRGSSFEDKGRGGGARVEERGERRGGDGDGASHAPEGVPGGARGSIAKGREEVKPRVTFTLMYPFHIQVSIATPCARDFGRYLLSV